MHTCMFTKRWYTQRMHCIQCASIHDIVYPNDTTEKNSCTWMKTYCQSSQEANNGAIIYSFSKNKIEVNFAPDRGGDRPNLLDSPVRAQMHPI